MINKILNYLQSKSFQGSTLLVVLTIVRVSDERDINTKDHILVFILLVIFIINKKTIRKGLLNTTDKD